MKRGIVLLLACVFALPPAFAQEPAGSAPRRVRIGIDIRMGFQSCIDSWTPIAGRLSKAIPECRFVIVPLASQEDLIGVLERGDVDFTVLDPALELVAEDRFGVSPLATLVELAPGDAMRQADAACSGAIICRTDRKDIRTIEDLRGKRLSAVKPWSLTGWIAQWALLKRRRIDPQRDLAQVVFEGTHSQVVKSVLDGTADVGTLDADLLLGMARTQQIQGDAICVINPRGAAVPMASEEDISATERYPGCVLAKSATTSDKLAKRVAEALMHETVTTQFDGMARRLAWTVPANYSKVRHTLQTLMGPRFAESTGFPLPKARPAWLAPVLSFGGVCLVAAVVILVLRRRHRRRESLLAEQLETTRRELVEVRADKHRLDTILSLVGCSVDIVDDNDQMIYADSGLERRYGDWRGKKCYEYFCERETACPCCNRPGPLDAEERVFQDTECSMWSATADPHASARGAEGESFQMIGIPFHDESGKWLLARLHVPRGTASLTSSGQDAASIAR
jgi:ABC-type phosphate/phosphonate transport system substrate-binding protein